MPPDETLYDDAPRKHMERKMKAIPVWRMSAAIAVVVAIVYWVFAPDIRLEGWDSLCYASAAETCGLRGGVMGNHPLGHLVQNAAYVSVKSLGYDGRALNVIKVVNALWGGMAVAAVFFLLARNNVRTTASLGVTLCVAGSPIMLRVFPSADIYALALALAVLSWIMLIGYSHNQTLRSVLWSGVVAGLAVLTHQLNAFIVLAGMVMLVGMHRKWWHAIVFACSGGAVALCGYVLMGRMVLGSWSPLAIGQWMLGYGRGEGYGRYLSFHYVSTAFESLWQVIVFTGWPGLTVAVSLGLVVWLGGALVLSIIGMRGASLVRKNAATMLLLTSLVTAVLILWWEPMKCKFWLFVTVPLACVIGFGWEDGFKWVTRVFVSIVDRGRLAGIVLLVTGGVTFGFNIKYEGLRQRIPDDVFKKNVSAWISNSNPDDLLITAGDLVPQLMYWYGRPNAACLSAWLLAANDERRAVEVIRQQIERALANRTRVFIVADAEKYVWEELFRLGNYKAEDIRRVLDGYEREPAFAYINGFDGKTLQVYELSVMEKKE